MPEVRDNSGGRWGDMSPAEGGGGAVDVRGFLIVSKDEWRKRHGTGGGMLASGRL
jgi:hypothetical protein